MAEFTDEDIKKLASVIYPTLAQVPKPKSKSRIKACYSKLTEKITRIFVYILLTIMVIIGVFAFLRELLVPIWMLLAKYFPSLKVPDWLL